MAPIKFEENIREKLEERELQPSDNAWSKLSSQLNKKDESKNNTYLWYAIAASFIGVIIIASVFFNNETNPSEGSQEIVNEESLKKDSFQEDLLESNDTEPKELRRDELAVEVVNEESESQTPVVKNSVEKNGKINITNSVHNPTTNKSNYAVVETSNTPTETIQSSNQIQNDLIMEDVIINTKVDEVVAQVKALKIENNGITAEELDALMISAQREVQNQRILTSNKIDPSALLEDVEQELERSFRDKVFDALGDGYLIIRTAVAERNN